MRTMTLVGWLALASAVATAGNARAQGAAVSTNLDCSVRAAGMGRSSNAVFWGGDPDYWSNPALLGYHSGVRYEYGRTQLVPDLADDVFFTTKRLTAAAYGLGFAFADKPIDGLGSIRLDYGTSQATSPTGEDLGTFSSYEDVSSWGMGLSVGRATEAIWRAAAHTSPSFLRYGDIAFGVNHKEVVLNLSPDLPGLPGIGQGKGEADDSGLLIRLSPYNSFDGPGFSESLDRSLQLAVDVGYGASTINRGPPTVHFGDGSGYQMLEESRKGWATRVALQPVALTREFQDHNVDWLRRSLSPAVSFGAAWDDNRLRYEGYDYLTGQPFPAESKITKSGWELGVLNVFSLRHGHISDPDGSLDGDTDGWSLGYTMDGIAGFRYDDATVPQATDPTTGISLDDVHRHAWTFFIDPVRYLAVKGGDVH